MELGLIQGRHELPVEKYLLEASVTEKVGYGQDLYHKAFSAVREADIPRMDTVRLYITGLTIAVLGALDGFRSAGYGVVVMTYNRDSKAYEEVHMANVVCSDRGVYCYG